MCGLYVYTPSNYWLVVEPTHLKNMGQIEAGMIIKKYLKPPPRLEWHCSFKRRKHRYGKTVNPSGSTKQSSNITASTKHLCHPPPLSLLNQNCHMGVSLNGGTPRTPQNDHF